MKKVLSLLTVFCLIFALSIPVFATNGEDVPSTDVEISETVVEDINADYVALLEEQRDIMEGLVYVQMATCVVLSACFISMLFFCKRSGIGV